MLAALVVTQTVGGDRAIVIDERLAGVVAGGVAVWLRAPIIVVMLVAGADRRPDSPVLGSPAMRVEEMVERVWPGRRAQIEVLGGGITNRNFKVTLDDGAYVLRIGGKDTELLGIDRRVEHEASLAAAAVGVGPEVVAFVEPEGYLVTRFIEGEVVEPEAIREPEALRRVAQSLRAVHAGPPIAARFDSFRVVEAYAATAATHGVTVPPAFERARETAALVERARGPVPERPCHNDLLTANFIDDGVRIRIVDWEYAGMGDVFFDLANLAVNNGLSDDDEHRAPPRLLRRRQRRARARADADAIHVRLPRGDVGRRPAGPLGPGLRLPRLRGGALRPARAHRVGALVPEGALGLALGEEERGRSGCVREHGDRRHDLESRVHRHKNVYRHSPDTA